MIWVILCFSLVKGLTKYQFLALPARWLSRDRTSEIYITVQRLTKLWQVQVRGGELCIPLLLLQWYVPVLKLYIKVYAKAACHNVSLLFMKST